MTMAADNKLHFCKIYNYTKFLHCTHGIALTNTCKSACTQYKWNSKLQLDRTLKSDEQAKPHLSAVKYTTQWHMI